MVDPQQQLRRWLPHLLLGALLVAAAWWLLAIISPIRSALMMGISLALVTNPILFTPLDGLLQRLFPAWTTPIRRYISSILCVCILLLVAALLVLLLLWAILGDPRSVVRAAIGLAFQNPHRIQEVIDTVALRLAPLLALYPSLGLTQADIRSALGDFLIHSHFGPEFVKLIFTGTGALIVQVILSFTTLFYLYIQGPQLARFMFDHLPLSQANQQALQLRFHRTVQHLLAETLGRALLMGLALGAIAWLVAGFNPVLVGLVAVFAGLLPIVGPAFVWLPLASLLASKGRWIEACSLVAASWSAAWLIERLSQRLARALGTDDTWLSFLLFCSIVGGVLGSGMRGLILGPAAVITVVVLSQFVISLYGQEPQPIRPGELDQEDPRRAGSQRSPAQQPSTGIPPKP